MKLTTLTSTLTKLSTLGLLAGAFALAGPAQANAQVAVGVRIAAPVVYTPFRPVYRPPVVVAPGPAYGFYGPGFYERRRVEEFRRGWYRR